MQEMSRKNQHFTDSVIRRMTRISIDCGAINLAQGFPDFDPPKAMLGIYAKVRLVAPKTIARSEGKAVRIIDKRKI